MSFDFSLFLNKDTLIFFAIGFIILAVVAVICFIIIRAIFRFIKSFLRKEQKGRAMEGALSDKGEDLGVYVEELERSKAERLRVQSQQSTAPIKAPVVQYNQSASRQEAQIDIDKEKEYAGKTQKDIEAGEIADDKNQSEISSRTAPNKSSVIQANRMGNLRRDDIKISKEAFSKDLEVLAKSQAPEGVLKSQPKNEATPLFEKPNVLKNIPQPAKVKEKRDTSFFRGRESIKMNEAVWQLTKKTSPYQAGGSYTLKERQAIAKKISDTKKFGVLLEKSDKAKILSTLQKEKMRASPSERVKILKQERFIKNIFR